MQFTDIKKNTNDFIDALCSCYNNDPSITALTKCLGLSKQEFYRILRAIRSTNEIFFVPNLEHSNLILAEIENPKVHSKIISERTITDLSLKKRIFLYIPVPLKDPSVLAAVEDILKATTNSDSISFYTIEAVCCKSTCLRPRKIVAKPSWVEVLISSLLTERFLLSKEMASKLKPLLSWQRAIYLLRGVLEKGLVLGPIFRSKNRKLLTIFMDIEVSNKSIFEVKTIPHWIKDSLVVLRKLNDNQRTYAMVFSTEPYYLEQMVRFDEKDLLSFKITNIRTFGGGTRIIPSVKEIKGISSDQDPLEIYAKALFPKHKRSF